MLLLIGVIALSCVVALFLGAAMDFGLNDAPDHVSNRHWQRVTERHVPMGTFRRVK